MECSGNVMSHAPYIGLCECPPLGKLRRLLGPSLFGINPSASQLMSSIDVACDVTGVSGVNNADEDKPMMLKSYRDLLPIHHCWYEFHLCNCCSGNLSVTSCRGEENDACNTILLY